MNVKYSNRKIRPARGERGVVLIAVLMFIAMILPVTLLILDTVRIESLLPVNEAYTRTAGDEADKGFTEAIAAIMADQDPTLVDISSDLADPAAPPYFIDPFPGSPSGKHEFDYLSEMWARHPDNDTIFLVERSLENYNGANPEDHSVPARWQLMNVPFGMDDFGEYYQDPDNPRILLPFEYVGQRNIDRVTPAYYADASELSMMEVGHEGDSATGFTSTDLTNGFWQLSPADPNYYTNIATLDTIRKFFPRPASYFRNTSGDPSTTSLNNIGLPTDDTSVNPQFIREANENVDSLVYDSFYDYNLNGTATTQYPLFTPLQQAVTDSTWANKYFGSTGSSTTLTSIFTTNNLEYKPTPGSISRYQLGSNEEDAIPGWHETIVSDESGRFPINRLLNIIFASDNVDYNNPGPDEPWARRDQFDADFETELMNNVDHPNHGGYLMARDILTSLLMPDEVIARLADTWDAALYQKYQDKARWIIKQMLKRRLQLDESSDINRNGDYSDDETHGEVFQFAGFIGNNDSNTLDIAAPGLDILDGSGRSGDGQDIWDGTWQVYTNPKEILTNFTGDLAINVPVKASDFDVLNQRVTVYSMETEHTADPEHAVSPVAPLPVLNRLDVRHNINRMQRDDNINTTLVQENALWEYLLPRIGLKRVESIVNWREGLVDVNGDGDLDDEYIEQPVSVERYDPTSNLYGPVEDWPVSTFTYRERNHPNFQDPALPASSIDPDYLNLTSLGDLITVPMSSAQGLIAYSWAPDDSTAPRLTLKDENGNDPPTGPVMHASRSVYPDFSNSGSEIAYDDGTDVLRDDLTLTNGAVVEDNVRHPSWGPGDAVMAYYTGDNIRMYDFGTATDSSIINGADLPPDITDTQTETDQFWSTYPGDLIGDVDFEMASPDINPNASYNEVAFTQVANASTGEMFLDEDVAYNLAIVDIGTGLVDLLTDNDPNDLSTFDYAPDFSSNGEMVVFTRTSYNNLITILLNAFGIDVEVPLTTINAIPRTGGFPFAVQAEWDFGSATDGVDNLVEIDFSPPNQLLIQMHQPMFPSVSEDGGDIIFMDVPITFTVDIVSETISVTESNADIYRTSLGDFTDFTDWFKPWTEMTAITNTANQFEIFPDWGLGSIRLTRQLDNQGGNVGGIPIIYTNAPSTDAPFDLTERQYIATDIGIASLALRAQPLMAGSDQNWHLADLPKVPEHTVDILEELGDIICFRDPYPYFAQPAPGGPGVPVVAPPLQTYPGNVNINTATRPVLRSTFLLMFQGTEMDVDGDGATMQNNPMPRVENGASSTYINLARPSVSNFDRFQAMLVADKYAQQVCEYRSWVYDNEGYLGITDETVPSNLPLYENEYLTAGITHYRNYRGNPFYPPSDTDGDPNTIDLKRQSPDPPFRSASDLFKVMLYDGETFNETWLYEGFGADGGPDPDDLPEAYDPSGAVTGSVNAFDVWGPIFNASDERKVTHHSSNVLGGGEMTGFRADVNNDPGSANYNNFNEHQEFRLFSADDFRRIAPFVTTRSYNYRIESRGVMRVSSGARRTDITRDKIWIISTNTDAAEGLRMTPNLNVADIYNSLRISQNEGTSNYYVVYFEEAAMSGINVTRSSFTAE